MVCYRPWNNLCHICSFLRRAIYWWLLVLWQCWVLSLCSPRWGDGAHNLPGVPGLSHSSLVHPSLIHVSLNNHFSYCALALCKKPQLKREITLQRTMVCSQKHHCRKGKCHGIRGKEHGGDATCLLEWLRREDAHVKLSHPHIFSILLPRLV